MARLPALPAYCAVAAADVVLAASGRQRPRRLTKPLLMPLLAAAVAGGDDSAGSDDFAGTGHAAGAKPLILAGLALSWVGDVALLGEGEGPFAAGLAAFLAAHGCYLAAFAKRRGGGIGRARWAAGAYGLAWCGFNLMLLPRTGRLRYPVLVYGTALVAMALAALETADPTITAGGAAFVMSDGILATDTFGVARLPGADGLVMLTYTAAQALIARGMLVPARVSR